MRIREFIRLGNRNKLKIYARSLIFANFLSGEKLKTPVSFFLCARNLKSKEHFVFMIARIIIMVTHSLRRSLSGRILILTFRELQVINDEKNADASALSFDMSSLSSFLLIYKIVMRRLWIV